MPTAKTTKPMFNLDTKLTQWVEYHTDPTGTLTHKRSVVATEWVEHERTDCFCCSCDGIGAADYACRNHGFYGRRPCERHGQPGELDDDGVMPDSVERERTRLARLTKETA